MSPVNYGPIQGEHGTAVPVVVPPVPECACLLAHWLITARHFHPHRVQWVLAANSLADFPGFPPAQLNFPGATHEFIVMPLDPAGGEQTPGSLVRLLLSHTLPMAADDAVTFQLAASGDEAGRLVPVMAASVVCEGWSPDVTSDPPGVRDAWRKEALRNLAAARTPGRYAAVPPGGRGSS